MVAYRFLPACVQDFRRQLILSQGTKLFLGAADYLGVPGFQNQTSQDTGSDFSLRQDAHTNRKQPAPNQTPDPGAGKST